MIIATLILLFWLLCAPRGFCVFWGWTLAGGALAWLCFPMLGWWSLGLMHIPFSGYSLWEEDRAERLAQGRVGLTINERVMALADILKAIPATLWHSRTIRFTLKAAAIGLVVFTAMVATL
jgi:hypothetical protein